MEPIQKLPGAGPRLDAPLAARLRALPAPDPGAAYFAALPDRVVARVQREAGARTPGRAPVRHARPRKAAWALVATTVLIVLVWGLPHARRADAPAARIAQQPLPKPAPNPVPEASPAVPTRAPELDAREPAPQQRVMPLPRRARPSRRPAPPAREATTARPRGGMKLAGATMPQERPVPLALFHTLERARVVLLTLAHADSTDDLGVLQPLAEALAADLAAQRPAFDAADPALRTVADRLEPLLLTLAHPDRAPGAMATLRARVREDETMFRLNVALLAAGPTVPVD